jgi:hypothetical protein
MLSISIRAVLVCSAACAFALSANLAGAAPPTQVVKVDLGTDAGEFTLRLTPRSVKVGPVIFKVANYGSSDRDFKVCASNKGGLADFCTGTGTAPIVPQHSTTLKITFAKPGRYEVLCTCPNLHGGSRSDAARSLRADLTVV